MSPKSLVELAVRRLVMVPPEEVNRLSTKSTAQFPQKPLNSTIAALSNPSWLRKCVASRMGGESSRVITRKVTL